MNKLVVHHTYTGGRAFDISNNNNHGALFSVAPGYGPFADSMRFTGGPSRVFVTPSPTLRDLRAIRVKVRFQHTPDQPGTRRHNLTEGYLSFALFVHPNGAIQGTIVDRSGAWRGPASRPGVIQPNQWYDVEFLHDGVSHARLYVNGSLVASMYDVVGPVRDVATPYGLAIGHWPDPGDWYTLEGYIDDFRLWKYDPTKDIRDLVDACCLDRSKLDDLVGRLRDAGWDSERLRTLVQGVMDLGTEVAAAGRAGDGQKTGEAADLTRQAMLAMGRRDVAGFDASLRGMQDFFLRSVSMADLEAFGRRALAQVRELPFDLTELADLARILCWDVPGPEDREPDRREPEEREEPKEGERRVEGDPHTDAPEGEEPPGWRLGGEEDTDPNSPVLEEGEEPKEGEPPDEEGGADVKQERPSLARRLFRRKKREEGGAD